MRNTEFIPALAVVTSKEIWHVINVHDHLDIDELIGNLTAYAVAENEEGLLDVLDVQQEGVMKHETEKCHNLLYN
jgi:hypothetical protein